MALRNLVLNNFRWKITAWVLAMLLWFSVKFTIYKGSHQVLRHQPVLILKGADDPRTFRLQPPEVDVILQSTKELHKDDIEVYVNLSTLPIDVESAFKQVLVRGAEDSKIIRVEPVSFVLVEQASPPGLSLTNSLKKP
jgi:hypothetical protein